MVFLQTRVCISVQVRILSQMEGWTDRITFQETCLSLVKWHLTARFISGSSVLFTLFNCLTVSVYAVPLPILSVSIKQLSFPSINVQHLEFASSCTAGWDQTPCGCPTSCRCHSHILELRRGQSTLKALLEWRVCMSMNACVTLKFPWSQ